ncbi:unnamed protein product [Caenorhabditis brenneri]
MQPGKRSSSNRQAPAAEPHSQGQDPQLAVSRRRGRPPKKASDDLADQENIPDAGSSAQQSSSSNQAKRRKEDGKRWTYKEIPSHSIYDETLCSSRTRSGQAPNVNSAPSQKSVGNKRGRKRNAVPLPVPSEADDATAPPAVVAAPDAAPVRDVLLDAPVAAPLVLEPAPALDPINEQEEEPVDQGRPEALQVPQNPLRPPLREEKPQFLLLAEEDIQIAPSPQPPIDQNDLLRESYEKSLERTRQRKENTLKEIEFEPVSCIDFKPPYEVQGLAHLKMRNTSSVPVVFKVKPRTTNNRICVVPETGYIEPKGEMFIQIKRSGFSLAGKQENIGLDALVVKWIDTDGFQGEVTYEDLKDTDNVIRSRQFRVLYG